MDIKYMTRKIREELDRGENAPEKGLPGMSADPKEIKEVTTKPRVFFDCHPDDFAEAFPLITRDILRHVNCAIWYDADTASAGKTANAEDDAAAGSKAAGPNDAVANSGSDPDEPFLAVIKRMQLIVLAVSGKFIHSPNRAKDVVLKTALEEHIPILPIMLENGLGYEFSNNCAKIQVVNRYVTDPTAKPYEEVLDTFLNAVLIGDELAAKVRAAFDAYVFLSYRKKDRYYAQRLMRLIHENREFRDIAIWYDEFLVPGEGFNEAIKDAFGKSGLFTMCVTPHLEEQGNYVMKNEYKWARERGEKSDEFQIVPVEMYDDNEPEWRIDQSKLGEFPYKSIDDLKNEHVRPELDSALIEALAKIAKQPHKEDARHSFFIGLAYLAGIDVEVDYDRALTLIKEASIGKKRSERAAACGACDEKAEPCIEATEKLVDMYCTGEGVAPDRKEAIRWQRAAADQYFDKYRKFHDPDEHKGYGTRYFKALIRLGDLLRDDRDIRGAIETAEKALQFSGELEAEVGIREMSRDIAVIYNQLGSMYKTVRKYDQAVQYYLKACEIYERLAHEIGTARARRDLSISYEHLGDIKRRLKDPAAADKYYRDAAELRRALSQFAPQSLGAMRDLSAIYTKMGNLRKDAKSYEEAGELYGRALVIDRALAYETRTAQARDDLSVSLIKVGDIRKKQEEYPEAVLLYDEAEEICRKLRENSAFVRYQKTHATACEKLAGTLKYLDIKETENGPAGREKILLRAADLYREAIQIREQIVEEAPTEENLHELAVTCYNAWRFLKEKALIDRAAQIWTELCENDPRYEKYRDMAVQ